MSYDSKKREFEKEHIYVVEIDAEKCALTFGSSPCVGGLRSITTTAVSVDDFNVGDEIEGATSGAIAEIFAITGSSPTYTFEYRVTNGIDFQTAAETINNNTASGVATKDGNAPTLLTTSDGKCYNTLASCQDTVNYDGSEIQTYRCCEARSPHPPGLDAVPNISDISISPTEVKPGGGIALRSSVSITYNDHPHSDIGIDPYLSDRTFDPLERGTYWTKWRARNAFYENYNMRILSGYLENGAYDSSNFQTRHYVLAEVNASRGRASTKAKDPLQLVTNKKALAPSPSNGVLNADITAGATSLTLKPTGIGSEYPTSGKVKIQDEVIEYSGKSSDTLTGLTRGSNNTTAAAHSEDDTVQLCLEYNTTVDVILEDLLTTYAGVTSSFIPTSEWSAEVTTFLSNNASTLITDPTSVDMLVEEICEQWPLKLVWDDRSQEIKLIALKAPPASADVLDMDENILADSVTVRDRNDMQVSTIFVYYGQFDPTREIDDKNNYLVTYARVNTDAIQRYGSDSTKVIYSRWISAGAGAAARQLAALHGRRFGFVPREINFELDAKDSSLWVGDTRALNHRDMVDFTGLPQDVIIEILSAKEQDNYNYKALEFIYDDELPEDEGGAAPGVDLVLFTIDEQNVNLRTRYEDNFGTPDASTVAKFVVTSGVIIGSSSTASDAMDTGTWPAGATITLQTNSGSFVVGAGGGGGDGVDGDNGGDAINMQYDLTLVNNGVIGGGGGGGAGEIDGDAQAGGGGGAGDDVGPKGLTFYAGAGGSTTDAEDGTLENGGAGGEASGGGDLAEGAAGGDLGQNGNNSLSNTGGTAGFAIRKNGNTLTESVTGDIRGTVS